MELIYIGGAAVVVIGAILLSMKTVRPSERGLIERFGKYNRFAAPGLQFIIPLVENLITVDITEDMVDAKQQEVITKDSLNVLVDAQIYFKVREDEESVKRSQYAVNDYYVQIVSLTRTTLRAVIGSLTLMEANSQRDKINIRLGTMLAKETKNWGIDVVRAELKEIQPPEDVQHTMNAVVMASKKKQAAVDFAKATETEADGKRMAVVKEAEGNKSQQILEAEGQAKAIELVAKANAEQIRMVNGSANKYFTGHAIELKRLEVAQSSLQNNTKYFVQPGVNFLNMIDSSVGGKIIPIKEKD